MPTPTSGAIVPSPAARMVPRMISAGKASSTTIERSRTTRGCGGSLTSHKKWPRSGLESKRRAERVPDALDDAFDVEEVDVAIAAAPVLRDRAGPGDRDRARFAAGVEPVPDFEERHVAPAVPAVVRDSVDEPRSNHRTQRVELAGQRIGDRDPTGRAAVKGRRRLCLEEPEGHGFRK